MAPLLRTALVLSIGVAVFAYMMRPRFPDTASNHTIKTVSWAYLGVINLVASTGGLVGLSPLNITRWLISAQLVFDKKRDTVEEYTTEMDGVEVTIFKPAGQSEGLRPAIVHYHGGGWVLGSPAFYAPYIRVVVEYTQSVIISVNYRLAPEHVFPTPVEDCLKATRYFLRHAEQYGADPNKIGVKGDSAGGNLAMAVALRLAKEADQELPTFKLMSLDYPALQAFDLMLPSYQKYQNGPGLLQQETMVKFWLSYAFGHHEYFNTFCANNHTSSELKSSKYASLVSWDYLPNVFTDGYKRDIIHEHKGDKELSDKIRFIILDPLFAPLMASDEELSLLPPTYVMSAEFDVLRDEGFIVVERLRSVGIEVEHTYLSSEQHGFLNLVKVDPTAVNEIVSFSKFFKRIME